MSINGLSKYLRFYSKPLTIALVIFISLVGLYFRYAKYASRALWGDEYVFFTPLSGHTFRDTPLMHVIGKNLTILQFPGDVILLWSMAHYFGENKWVLALPHILITILGFYLLYKLCSLYFKTTWGYVITFLVVAFNANLVFASFELRPYGVLAVLSIASFLVMKIIVEKRDPSPWEKIGINAFIFMLLLFHMYGSWILFFTYLFHFVASANEPRGKIIFRNLKHYSYGFVLAMPLWIYFTFGFDKEYLQRDTFEFIKKGIVPWLKGVFGNLIGFRLFYLFLPGLIALILPQEDNWKQIWFFILLIWAPILLLFFVCYIHKYWFIQRLFTWEMPLFAFLLGWVWDSLFLRFSRKVEKNN